MGTHSFPHPKADDRIEIRIDTATKELLERAAALLGFHTLSAYMRHLAIQDAKKEILSHTSIELSQKDWKLFCDILKNPPVPNEALRKAAEKFKGKYDRNNRK